MRSSHSNFGNFDPKKITGFSYRSNSNSNSGFKTFYSKSKDDKKWIKIQAPDFKRMSSREILEKEDPNKEKKRLIPSRFPSYTAINESKFKIFL